MGKILLFGKVVNWTLYPWLLALYPVIYLYSVNQADIREDDVLEVLFVLLVATTVVYIITFLLVRDIYKSGAVTGVIALMFLTYGHIYNALGSSDLGQQLLMPLMIVLSFVAILLILRAKTIWQRLVPYLNMIFVVLVIMPSLQVVSFWIDRPPLCATAQINPL